MTCLDSFLHGYWAVGSWMGAGLQTDELCLDSFLIGSWFLWYQWLGVEAVSAMVVDVRVWFGNWYRVI